MSNIDKQAVTAKTKELASFMVERFSMNPVSCKLLNEAWEKEFPDEVAIAERMLALLDELEAETRYREGAFIACNRWHDKFREADDKLEAAERRIAELEHSETQLINERDSAESALNDAYKAVMGQAPEWSNWFSFENAIDEIELVCELWRNQTDDVIQFRQRIAELESNEIREDGNQFLVVRHPGKTPVIKHWSGDPEEFLRNLIEQDPLVTIDIITHRYYGVGGQWVQDADEYLHMMAAAGTGKGK